MKAILIILAILAVAPPAASARKRADLVVSTGTVRVVHDGLKGSFAVRNRGGRRAPASIAILNAKGTGRKGPLGTFTVPGIGAKRTRVVKVAVIIPDGLPSGTLSLRACADSGKKVRERSEGNNCRAVGTLVLPPPPPTAPAPAPTATAGPTASPAASATPTSTPPPTSVPSDPVAVKKDEVLDPGSGRAYWTYVPEAYDASHQTPIALLVWLHGCEGNSSGDIYTVSPGGNQSYIAITVDGAEGGCWNVNADSQKVLTAIANAKTHFNIAPRRVVIGGYSSGGDLAYRTAFYNANTFAGLLAENTSPFRDTGSSQADSLAAASWRFNVVHLAHLEDGTYPIDGVRDEVAAMQSAGFPVTLVEREGEHGDETTDPDLRSVLLPHMTDAWLSP